MLDFLYDQERILRIREMNIEKEAMAKGLSQGKIEGKMEGMVEGKIEGKVEGVEFEKVEVAKRMKKRGLDLDLIMACTELSKEQIDNL